MKASLELNDRTEPQVCSRELLEALRRWRYFEKKHAAAVLGELDVDETDAEHMSERALHQLRIVADKVIRESGLKLKP